MHKKNFKCVRSNIYELKNSIQNLLKLQIILFYSEALEKICNFNKFCVFFFIHITYIHTYI